MADLDELTARYDRMYREQVAGIAKMLRDVADRFERDGLPDDTPSVMGVPRYATAATRACHALVWGIANAGPQDLTRYAALADAAEARSEAGESDG